MTRPEDCYLVRREGFQVAVDIHNALLAILQAENTP
jgi:hypothetical protein